MLNFLGRRNSDQYTLALADSELSALSLLAGKTNLFGTCDNPAGLAGAGRAESAFFETGEERIPTPGRTHRNASVLPGRGNNSGESENS